jgi:hypothetical protein
LKKGDLVKINHSKVPFYDRENDIEMILRAWQSGTENGYYYLADVLWQDGSIETMINHHFLLKILE